MLPKTRRKEDSYRWISSKRISSFLQSIVDDVDAVGVDDGLLLVEVYGIGGVSRSLWPVICNFLNETRFFDRAEKQVIEKNPINRETTGRKSLNDNLFFDELTPSHFYHAYKV